MVATRSGKGARRHHSFNTDVEEDIGRLLGKRAGFLPWGKVADRLNNCSRHITFAGHNGPRTPTYIDWVLSGREGAMPERTARWL